jgi:cytochrome c556
MRMKTMAAAACVGALISGSVLAAGEGTHEAREGMMKNIARATATLGRIAKGDTPYDAASVKTALTTIAETAKLFPDQFKPGTEKSEDKLANPQIFENMADFKARAEKLSSEAEAALATLPADPAAVGATVKTLGAECGGCHQSYRSKD